MEFKKTLCAIVAAAAIATTAGCSTYTYNNEYEFSGKIGQETVDLGIYRCGFYRCGGNELTVQKSDKTLIKYIDTDGSKEGKMTIEKMEITLPDKQTSTIYADSKNPASQKLIKDANKQFNDYLRQIIEIKKGYLNKK